MNKEIQDSKPRARAKFQGRPKAAAEEDRSAAIVAAAFQVFARSGYAAARMEEIAELAGVTKGLIYFYFENKEALFKAVIRNHLFENIHTRMDLLEINPSRSMASHLMQALALISRVLDERNNPLVPGVLRLLLTEGQRFADLQRFHYQEVMQPIMGRFRHILEEGARRGEWQQERVPPFIQMVVGPMVIRLIWNMVFGASDHLDEAAYLRSYQICLLQMLGVTAEVDLASTAMPPLTPPASPLPQPKPELGPAQTLVPRGTKSQPSSVPATENIRQRRFSLLKRKRRA